MGALPFLNARLLFVSYSYRIILSTLTVRPRAHAVYDLSE